MKHVTLAGALAAAVAVVAAPAAQAALVETGVSCNGQGTGMTSQAGFLDCSGAWSGNNSNQSADVAAQIQADWGLTNLSMVDITGGNTGSSGTLSFTSQSGTFVIALKAGDAFSLYEFTGAGEGGAISSINFDTLGVGFFSGNPQHPVEHFGQGLSHADLYWSPSPVPEPSTWALTLAGLGLLGFLAKRRAG
jgi:hypothetical protein